MKERTSFVRQAFRASCIALLLVISVGVPLAAQEPAPSALQPLSPVQLDSLVAPIALYPDALLSQVLVASTYPLELVEAGQWLQQNPSLQGPPSVDAARQQDWDPSIQALVVFPDVIARLNSNIRWTTDLGNAFLAQQADVMNAVQRLRAEARAEGKLNSDTEQTIATDTEGGQTAIEIQPTDPDVMYVPDYNPEDIWASPDGGYYPALYYPDTGLGFGPGIYIGGFFGGLGEGGLDWGGWGWGPNWFNCTIFENGYFFDHYGFHGFDGRRGFALRGTWAHNPQHRLGVAYPNQAVASRFGGAMGGRVQNRGDFGAVPSTRIGQSETARLNSGPQPNNRTNPAQERVSAYRSAAPNESRAGAVRATPSYRPSPSSGSAHSAGGSSHSSGGGGGSHGGRGR